MDGFTGSKTAAEDVSDAVAVMDPFMSRHWLVTHCTRCRQRVQQQTCGHPGRSGDALYGARWVLRTGADLLTDKQKRRPSTVLNNDAHVEVEATWHYCQRIVATATPTAPPPRPRSSKSSASCAPESRSR